jgi:Xaa-Pro dipeptidase
MKLTVEGCRARQQLLQQVLADKGLEAAILAERQYVHYFSGHLCNTLHSAALLIKADGTTVLAAAVGTQADADNLAADEIVEYAPDAHCTLHCRQLDEATKALSAAIPSGAIGSDAHGIAGAVKIGRSAPVDLSPELLHMRRSKHPDEVAAIRDSIHLTSVMYDTAKATIGPGVDEVDVFSEILAATTREAGEFLEFFGNDFQANSGGGKARRRKMNAGELYVLDAGPRLHGYAADNCRSFAVDGSPTDAQMKAWQCIDSVFAVVEPAVKPGIKAVDVYNIADQYFKDAGYAGMIHHLGHGIGLNPHEPPELNPEYDAVFDVGNVITMEPGLYADELRAGIRLEENYLVTETGVEKLTTYPREMV